MLEFTCPNCGKRVQGDESFAGKRILCPGCEATIMVPQPVSTAMTATTPHVGPRETALSEGSPPSIRAVAPHAASRKTLRAVLEWVPKESGGRRKLPPGAYVTPVRLAGDPWPRSVGWSLVVRKIEVLEHPLKWLVDVHFLAQEAPHHLLQAGVEFELYEGKPTVAYGRIIGE
jgi:DNA-directed RNA polymerase subunit RPC12/RpoP